MSACVLVCLLAAAVPSVAAAAPGKRVTIGVVGDSVAEGYLVRHFLRDGFVPRLTTALVAEGFSRGGFGLIPTNPVRWLFSKIVRPGPAEIPEGAWKLFGFGNSVGEGPSGYSVVAREPTARATAAVRGPEVGLVYSTTEFPTKFRVEAGSAAWVIDAQRVGPRATQITWIRLPEGATEIAVNGPSEGVLTFQGMIDRKPPPEDRIQIEVSNNAHTALLPADGAVERVEKPFTAMHYDITLLAWGFVSETLVDDKPSADDFGVRYERGLLRRAQLVKRTGSVCVIVDNSPLPRRLSVRRRFQQINERVARRAKCHRTSVLRDLWKNPQRGFEQGFALVDDIHPSERGYRLIAQALTPVLESLIRGRASRERPVAELAVLPPVEPGAMTVGGSHDGAVFHGHSHSVG